MASIEDFEQHGPSGYYYRRPYVPRRPGSAYLPSTCEGCGQPCMHQVGAPAGKGRFCSAGCGNTADRAGNWTGEDVGYRGAHNRVAKVRGRAAGCVWGCQATRYEWANLTGNLADTDDYAQMCRLCHTRFDAAIRMTAEVDGYWRPWRYAKVRAAPAARHLTEKEPPGMTTVPARMRVTFCYSVDNSGELRVHRANCKDAAREAPKAASVSHATVASKREAACEFYADFLREDMTPDDAVGWSTFLPCCDALPDVTPAGDIAHELGRDVAAALERATWAGLAPADRLQRVIATALLETEGVTATAAAAATAAALHTAGYDPEPAPFGRGSEAGLDLR